MPRVLLPTILLESVALLADSDAEVQSCAVKVLFKVKDEVGLIFPRLEFFECLTSLVFFVNINAEGGPQILLQVIIVGNVESAVINLCAADLLPQLWRPQGRLVRPVPGPFALAPRVS